MFPNLINYTAEDKRVWRRIALPNGHLCSYLIYHNPHTSAQNEVTAPRLGETLNLYDDINIKVNEFYQ